MLCPHCRTDLDDPAPECPSCGFHICDLDDELGPPPPFAGPLLDEAEVLDPDQKQRLLLRLERFRAATGCELVVVSRATTAPRLPSEYVFWLFNRWGVGGEAHRGILLLLAQRERRIEVEVGFGLEEIMTDEASQRILEAHCLPFLSSGRLAEGLTWGAEVLARVVENAEEEADR